MCRPNLLDPEKRLPLCGELVLDGLDLVQLRLDRRQRVLQVCRPAPPTGRVRGQEEKSPTASAVRPVCYVEGPRLTPDGISTAPPPSPLPLRAELLQLHGWAGAGCAVRDREVEDIEHGGGGQDRDHHPD